MRRLRQARPRPAFVVAVAALIAALAGTAIASDPVATTSISKKKTKKIAKKQANKAVDAVLPLGASNLGEIREESETFNIAGNVAESHTVDCNDDEQVISGGSKWDNFPGNPFVGITQADHRDGNGWRAGGRNFTGAAQPFTVYAYCLQP
jgi:hypothetical protein